MSARPERGCVQIAGHSAAASFAFVIWQSLCRGNAPAHVRVITTLRDWDIEVDETFFLGEIDKNRILEVFKPHIYFDDQLVYAEPAQGVIPSVHVPFGGVPSARRLDTPQTLSSRRAEGTQRKG